MKRAPRGFTLIELMVALVVSSLLVGMILAIFSRMSIAYRGQQQIAGVQQVLAAARATIELDAKQAGFAMSQGFVFTDNKVHQPVQVINNFGTGGPDQIAFYYGDAGTQAAVRTAGAWSPLDVDSTAGFVVGDLVVVSSVDMTMAGLPGNDGNIARYSACVVKIASMSTNQFVFVSAAHCIPSLPVPSLTTMVYKLVAKGYRIDLSTPARAALGPLQQSDTGNLLGVLDDWKDLAYGFTDIQTALQIYDETFNNTDSADPGTDAFRDWYSDGVQDTLTETRNVGAAPPLTLPDGLLQMSISLVARTDRNVEGIATSATPTLTEIGNPSNNTVGDRLGIALPSVTDPALGGARIYRYTTFQVDFRNIGIGR